MRSIYVLLLVVVLAAAPAFAKWKKPEFCGKSDCPPFEIDEQTDDFKDDDVEVRIYEEGRWAVTNVTSTKYELAYTKAAAKLMKYFKGNNDEEVTMELTTPTLAALKLEKDSQGTERDYSFSMWLPEEFQDKDEEAPEPTDEDIEIIDYPEIKVFVKSFGGFATESSILQQANALHEILAKEEVDFDKNVVFVAVYDPAVKLLNRHNEIHVAEKEVKPEPDVVISRR